MKRERMWSVLQRIVAVFFTWSAIGIVAYGLIIWRLDLLVMAVVWYLLAGGLAMQTLRDLEEATRGEGDFRNE